MKPSTGIVTCLAVLAGVFVFGWRAVDQSAKAPITQSTVMDDMYVLDVKDRVRAQLRDPSSAIFRSKIMRHPDNSYCGLVSAKNGFGGYGDAVQFFVDSSGYVAFDNPGDQARGIEGAATRRCKAAIRI